MIVHGKTIISDDVRDQAFVCDLIKCKGACCVEGDLGAPLELDELDEVEEAYPSVKPYLSEAGIKAIEAQGPYVLDEEGDFSTATIGGKECAFSVYDNHGILKCGIEQAWKDGKSNFRKPISCHLYPIRITRHDEFEALNYDRWHICSPACDLGTALKVPVYKFLKEALIRKYGKVWYEELEQLCEEKPEEKQGL